MKSPAIALLLVFLALPASAGQEMTDAQVRKAVIQESIARYPGNCPCPYNLARNGSRCGARSAYNRPGGAAPACFPDDVTVDMVASYRHQHGL